MELADLHQRLEDKKEELEEFLSSDILFIPYETQGRLRVEARSREFRKNQYTYLSIASIQKLIVTRGVSESQLLDMIIDDLKNQFKGLLN